MNPLKRPNTRAAGLIEAAELLESMPPVLVRHVPADALLRMIAIKLRDMAAWEGSDNAG